jgi:Copper transport outer membrane protein, MctB
VIDFRYHLVSIVAVFLALAIGLLVGATAIKPKTELVFDRLSKQEQQKISLQLAQIQSLENRLSGDQAAAKADAPVVLKNLLAGQQVVLVTAPGSDGATISGVTTALQQAGAKVTGQAALQPAFFGTSSSTQTNLETLAQSVVPPGVTLNDQTGQSTADAQIAGQQAAAQVLAPALVTKNGADLPADQTKPIIDGFQGQGFLQMNYESGVTALSQATLAVVIIPANPPASGDSDPANLALISLAEQLELSSRGVVIVGSYPGSGQGSAIDELINGATGIHLSTVDYANTEVGQIEAAQALGAVLAGRAPAAYGVISGAPAPAPTPTATATPTGSPGTKKSGG